MEGAPRNNENEPPARPKLAIDLTTWDGHWFNLVTAAQALLEGEALKKFNRDMGELLWRRNDTTYGDLFRTINAHMDLVDTLGALQEYAPQPSEDAATLTSEESGETHVVGDAPAQEPRNVYPQPEEGA